ncbi:elastin-like [Gadus macrocephalus]|uniref:elastin-like n=1 Tax=Gadus macrocephalus TaxID=80720 RepID=UPI0028CB6141|nr:elastin-like [Gadus macrocephalus]
MAEETLGALAIAKIALAGAAAGFALGDAALMAVDPGLIADGPLGSATGLAMVAGKVGSTGVAGVMASLVFAATFFSLGFGFNLASLLMSTLARCGTPHDGRLTDGAAGAFTAVGAVAAGLLGGLAPAWCLLGAGCMLVLSTYVRTDVNETATALLVIYVTLHANAVLGRMGVLLGLFATAMSVSFIVGLRKFLRQRWAPPPPSDRRPGGLLGKLSLSVVVVAFLGFPIGLGIGGKPVVEAGADGAAAAAAGGEAEVALLLEAVFWVGVLFAPLLGASLGTMGAVGLGTKGAARTAMAAAAASCLALGVVLPACTGAGSRSCLGGILGAAAATGLALAASRVALKAEHRATNVVHGAVVAGVMLGVGYASWSSAAPWCQLLASALTVSLVATMAFFCGAPRSPFNLQYGPGTGADLMRQLGKETVSTGAAPFGAGALGAAALGTAALGSLGAVGVAIAVALALGKTLKSMAEQPVKAAAATHDD